MARAVGDRRALGYALAARCDATSGPDGCDDRVAASAEIVRLGAETGDRQLELLGLRLRIVALLEIGDVGSGRRRGRAFRAGSPSGCANRCTAGTCRCGGGCAR